eukprot:TRINITY_DN305_c2_g2_i1.p1 TRINITY_DN305_c2_g2~~TRINITY_DN305_c2_g2_i1.p1  ORF type:complete len:153 (+),score=84.91 TRINITY_DN305_c2_g2_i1:225-683(+)
MDFLTQEQISEFREVFKFLDQEKEGAIKKNGLRTVMREMGIKVTDADISNMMNEADSSGKGSISLEAFITLMSDMMRKMDTPEDIRRAFECFDPYGRGFVSGEEFRHIMTVGNYAKFTNNELKDLTQAGASEKGEGKIDYYKLVDSVCQIPK